MSKIFCFGLGFTGNEIAKYFLLNKWSVTGTARNPIRDREKNIKLVKYDPINGHIDLTEELEEAHTVIISIPPNDQGDVVLNHNHKDIINARSSIKRIIYLSSTSVYGDADGKTVYEDSKINPQSIMASNRSKAEEQWTEFCIKYSIPLDILRLSGIYGKGRNQIRYLLNGSARRIIKEGQLFNRIHVEDIAKIVYQLTKISHGSEIFNISDDLPSPSNTVIEYASELLKIKPPEPILFKNLELNDKGRVFYLNNRIVSNAKIKKILNYNFEYPNYKIGLKSLIDIELND
ncbi:MAG: NAD-dependent epimerase/dehydratase family protein [Hyphomicrobiales bacterium]